MPPRMGFLFFIKWIGATGCATVAWAFEKVWNHFRFECGSNQLLFFGRCSGIIKIALKCKNRFHETIPAAALFFRVLQLG